MEQSKSRDASIDFMKGLAIVFMVMGHAGFPGTPFLSLFHMPVFFMISGYLWNDKNVKDLTTVKSFVLRKIKTLWLPFVQWNLIVLLCNNLFLALHFYTADPALAMEAGNLSYHPFMGLREMVKPILKTFFFRTDLELGGATWFLGALFMISLGHCLVRWLCVHLKFGQRLFYVISALIFIFVQLVCMRVPMPLHFMLIRAGFAYWAFLLGYWLKKAGEIKFTQVKSAFVWITAFAVLMAGYLLKCQISVRGIYADNVFVYTLMTVAGWFFCRIPCQWFPEKCRLFINALGKNSISILLYHFLAFKAISYLYVWITDAPVDLVASFPVISPAPRWLWIAYTLAGIGLSLLCGTIESKIKGALFSLTRKKKVLL